MTVEQTAAGTPILRFSLGEYEALLENEVERAVGLTLADFERAYLAGQLDDSDPAIDELIGLLRVGQNRYRRTA